MFKYILSLGYRGLVKALFRLCLLVTVLSVYKGVLNPDALVYPDNVPTPWYETAIWFGGLTIIMGLLCFLPAVLEVLVLPADVHWGDKIQYYFSAVLTLGFACAAALAYLDGSTQILGKLNIETTTTYEVLMLVSVAVTFAVWAFYERRQALSKL